jgi:hypothetical protein
MAARPRAGIVACRLPQPTIRTSTKDSKLQMCRSSTYTTLAPALRRDEVVKGFDLRVE